VENRSLKYPHGELGIIALSSCAEIGKKLDEHIKALRGQDANDKKPAGEADSYLIDVEEIRFSNGEAKTRLIQSVRGRDIYILCDPGNYSCTYDFYGKTNQKSPDDHFQDAKRAVAAVCGKASRTTVVMPLLYASRQDHRRGRESLDCAIALKELEAMGVKNIIAFDLHNSRVQNAVPLSSFENLYATYGILEQFVADEREAVIDNNNLIVISPDPGGMERAIYYAGVLDTEVGMFYKRRNYKLIKDGSNPIIQHDYLGPPVLGKNVFIVDDILASGDSLIDVAEEMKSRGAMKIFVAVTYGLFTKGYDKFCEMFEMKHIDRVYSTNLTYVPAERKVFPWYCEVDMSPNIAEYIDILNHDASIEPIIDATGSLKMNINNLRANRD
jgi:ribose-phosphate pyrophosphokinase